MPYIKQDRRSVLSPMCVTLGKEINNMGELNYCITSLLTPYLNDPINVNYEILNSIMGVLECVKQEFYERAIEPYEIRKCMENGDVY